MIMNHCQKLKKENTAMQSVEKIAKLRAEYLQKLKPFYLPPENASPEVRTKHIGWMFELKDAVDAGKYDHELTQREKPLSDYLAKDAQKTRLANLKDCREIIGIARRFTEGDWIDEVKIEAENLILTVLKLMRTL